MLRLPQHKHTHPPVQGDGYVFTGCSDASPFLEGPVPAPTSLCWESTRSRLAGSRTGAGREGFSQGCKPGRYFAGILQVFADIPHLGVASRYIEPASGDRRGGVTSVGRHRLDLAPGGRGGGGGPAVVVDASLASTSRAAATSNHLASQVPSGGNEGGAQRIQTEHFPIRAVFLHPDLKSALFIFCII